MASVSTTANKLLSNPPPEGEILEIEDHVDRQFRSLKHFDIVANPPPDHYYLDPPFSIKNLWTSPLTRNDTSGRKEKFFAKEWELLKSSLPSTIFVRAYSTRPELMRAAIIGLRDDNSPYTYGLFFFDIMLPAQYPAKPPQINYLFNGVALDVSRFMLTGQSWNVSCFGEARWDPERSSVLDVLGAIQRGMAARGRHMKEERRNEVFMLSHRAMHKTLQEPPEGFENLVKGYFRRFSHVILMQLKDYLDSRKSSGGERGYMEKSTFLQLISDFEDNGSYCGHIKLKS